MPDMLASARVPVGTPLRVVALALLGLAAWTVRAMRVRLELKCYFKSSLTLIGNRARLRAVAGLAIALAATASGSVTLDASPQALAGAMAGKRVVVLGEVHDNAAQHALRIAALRQLIADGARPALAFEQFDREQQAAIDRARRERPRDAAYVIAEGEGAPSWQWDYYRPFVQLALDYDLPIIAANLSRAGAMRVATGAVTGTEGSGTPPPVPAAVMRGHEAAIAKGHCDLLPPEALPGMASAQIARDWTLANAIRPQFARGVVLLTGNGHARTDIGVPFWLTPEERADSVSIGLIERDGAPEGEPAARFDAVVYTARAEREDPCADLRKRMGARSGGK